MNVTDKIPSISIILSSVLVPGLKLFAQAIKIFTQNLHYKFLKDTIKNKLQLLIYSQLTVTARILYSNSVFCSGETLMFSALLQKT